MCTVYIRFSFRGTCLADQVILFRCNPPNSNSAASFGISKWTCFHFQDYLPLFSQVFGPALNLQYSCLLPLFLSFWYASTLVGQQWQKFCGAIHGQTSGLSWLLSHILCPLALHSSLYHLSIPTTCLARLSRNIFSFISYRPGLHIAGLALQLIPCKARAFSPFFFLFLFITYLPTILLAQLHAPEGT